MTDLYPPGSLSSAAALLESDAPAADPAAALPVYDDDDDDDGNSPLGFVEPDDQPSFHSGLDGQSTRISPYTADGDTVFALSNDGGWVPVSLSVAGGSGDGTEVNSGPVLTSATPHIYDYSGGTFTNGQVPSPASPTTITITNLADAIVTPLAGSPTVTVNVAIDGYKAPYTGTVVSNPIAEPYVGTVNYVATSQAIAAPYDIAAPLPYFISGLLFNSTSHNGTTTIGAQATAPVFTFSFMQHLPSYGSTQDASGFAVVGPDLPASEVGKHPAAILADNSHGTISLNAIELQAMQAFAGWQAVGNIKFVAADDADTIAFRIGSNNQGHQLSAYSYVPESPPNYFADSIVASAQAADIYLGNGASLGYGSGGFGGLALAHEIAHGLGFGGESGAADINDTMPGGVGSMAGAVAGINGNAEPANTEDNVLNTVMTYNNGHPNLPNTPQLFDIATIEYLYGPNPSYHPNASHVWSFSSGGGANGANFGDIVMDGGSGTQNTISAAGATQNAFIDLRSGHWDYLGTRSTDILAGNQLFIDYGTSVQNAIGGDGNDTLIGNDSADSLSGGVGNDLFVVAGGDTTIDGGSGSNAVLFADPAADYSVSMAANGVTTVTETVAASALTRGTIQGSETLTNVRMLQFSDRPVTIDYPPVLAVPTAQTDVNGQSIAVAGIDASDLDSGDQTFAVTVSASRGILSTSGGAGTITGNAGISLGLAGTLADINSDLAALSFLGASVGEDTIQIQVTDGIATATQTIGVTITAPPAVDGAPVLTAPATTSVTSGSPVAVSGVSIADSDAVAQNQTLTVIVTSSRGSLSTTGTMGTVTGSGTSSLTVAGSLAQVNDDLAMLGFTGTAVGTGSVLIQVDDGQGGQDIGLLPVAISAPVVIGGGGGGGGGGDGVSLPDGSSNNPFSSLGFLSTPAVDGPEFVTVKDLTPGADGSVSLALPSGPTVDLSQVSFTDLADGEPLVITADHPVSVTLPSSALPNGMPIRFVATIGDNTIAGGGANAVIIGGPGNDRISLGSGGGSVVGGSGHATIDGGNAGAAHLGDAGGVTIVGAAAGGQITAGGNNSVVFGAGGTAVLIESINAGAALAQSGTLQVLVGSSDPNATDIVHGSSAAFTGAHDPGAPSTLLIGGSAGSTQVTAGTEEEDVVFGAASTNLTIAGGSGTLLAAVPNTASGHASITGGAGASFIFGGLGAVSVTGGAGALVVAGGGTGAAGETVTGGSGIALVFGSAGHDSVVGGGDGSEIQGGGLFSSLANGPGHSAILIAGQGADTFRINAASQNFVEIVGFRAGTDKLDLSAFGIGVGTMPSTAQTTTFGDQTAFDIHLPDGQELFLVGVDSLTGANLATVG